ATIVLFGALLFCLTASIKFIREKFMLRANLHHHGSLMHFHPHDEGHVSQDHERESSRIDSGEVAQKAK
ncbi:MAG: hypothetical protein ABJA60_07195, partial [Nitrosospira sp.]